MVERRVTRQSTRHHLIGAAMAVVSEYMQTLERQAEAARMALVEVLGRVENVMIHHRNAFYDYITAPIGANDDGVVRAWTRRHLELMYEFSNTRYEQALQPVHAMSDRQWFYERMSRTTASISRAAWRR
jgi:hypothetical protein